jgi:transposase
MQGPADGWRRPLRPARVKGWVQMARPLASDELWELIEPLIRKVKRRCRYPGRKRIDDRKVLSGILFVLRTGIPWEYLPHEMGCGSGMTCWRRLREWQETGVWQRLHECSSRSCRRRN